ncbi:MAG: hypothetical protein WD066_10765 [Planctomycetaceae bacterium]
MRLTLRTLLAYLDDMLEPNQAREIGVKIAESGVASSLVDRIREVMRRRRLGAPGIGDTPDANTVAEYLDNTLPADGVADLERICLESDVNLAEVAAAHQILTLVLGEPVEIPPWMRERMYALGPVSNAAATHRGADAARLSDGHPAVAATEAAAAPPAAGTAVGSPRREAFSKTIPDYLRPAPIWRRALPVAFVAGIAILWGVLMWGDKALSRFFRGEEAPRAGEGAVAAVDGQPADVPGDGAIAPAPQTADGGAPVAPAAVGVNDGPEGIPERGAVEDAEWELPAVAGVDRPASPVDEVRPFVAVDVPRAPAGQVEPGAEAPGAAAARPEEPPAVPRPVAPVMTYESTSGVALRHDAAVGDWFPLPREAVVAADEWLACPEPFEAEFDLGGGRAKLRLFGGTGIRYAAPPQGADFAIEIERGMLALERMRNADADDVDEPAPAADAPLVVSLIVRDESWSITLGSPGTRCAIEIVPRQPTGFEEELGDASYAGALYSVSGSVRFADGGGRERTAELSEGQWLPLGPEERGVAGTSHPLPAPQAMPTMPAWLDPQSPPLTAAVRRVRALFEKEFEPEVALGPSLSPVVGTPEPMVSELAVKSLALAGRQAELAHALARAPHEESRVAAIVGLRIWLGQNPKQGDLLRASLQRWFPPDTIDIVYRMLWGYAPDDARDPAISAELVQWLSHENLAVRQLAFFHVRNLTLGRTYDYLPHNLPAQRVAAVMRWQRHIEKEGALLAPASP